MTRTPIASLARTMVFPAVMLLASGSAKAAGPPGRMIDVGGRSIHIYCTGSGSPTIVLEAGGGNAFYTWFAVQPRLAARYRVCSYDRAGFAFSDPRPGTRTIAGIVEDLHTTLVNSGEKPPYLLVGHSLGAQFVWKYAERHPEGVIGLVFVDGNMPGLHQRRSEALRAAIENIRNPVRAKRLARIKEWRITGKWEEMSVPDGLPRDLAAKILELSATAKWWEARYAEGDLPDVEELLQPLKIPVDVLNARSTSWPSLSPALREENLTLGRTMAKELAASSPSGRLIEVDADHMFNESRPQIVIEAVDDVLSRSDH